MSTSVMPAVIDDYVAALLDCAPGHATTYVPPAPPVDDADRDDADRVIAPMAVGMPAVAAPTAARPATPITSEEIAPREIAAAAAPRFAATAPVQARPASVPASNRWLRVTVGGDGYALELLRVQEVVRLAPIVGMRGASRAVLGVMNLRGRIVPVFDLGLWLGTAGVRSDERSRIVVVERDDELLGVLVSAVEDVVTLGRDRIEPPLIGSDPGAILGIARVGAAPTVLLDADALFGS
jgi:purine-binding chemotaxis protein CheW